MEEENQNLKEIIKNYFDKQSYFEVYNFDIWVTILAIFFIIFIVFYVYINSQIKLEKINWEKNKCNPFYMPFAATVNNGSGKFNEDNFRHCLDGLTSNIAFDILSPINALVNLFSQILKFVAGMLSQLLGYIMHLFNMLVSLFREFMMILEKIIKENIIVFSKVNNFIASVLGFISLIYYKIVILVDSIKLIFPMMALAFLMGVILPAFIALIISIVLLIVYYIIGVVLSPIMCLGCWAWPVVWVWVIVVIFLLIFFILLIVLYIIFANACNDVLVKILRPVSNDDNEILIPKAPGNMNTNN